MPTFTPPSKATIDRAESAKIRAQVQLTLSTAPFMPKDFLAAAQACQLLSLYESRRKEAASQEGHDRFRGRTLIATLSELRQARAAGSGASAIHPGASPTSIASRSSPSSLSRYGIFAVSAASGSSDETDSLLGVEAPPDFLASIRWAMPSSSSAPHEFILLAEEEPPTAEAGGQTIYVCFSSQLAAHDASSSPSHLIPATELSVSTMPSALADNESDLTGSLVLTRYLSPACDVPVEPFITWLKNQSIRQKKPATGFTPQSAADDAKERTNGSEYPAVVDVFPGSSNPELANFYQVEPCTDPPPAAKQPALRIIFCGHGHGAAIAQLVIGRLIAAARCSEEAKRGWIDGAACLCFSPPAIANAKFYVSNLHDELCRRCISFTPCDDTFLHALNYIDSGRQAVEQQQLEFTHAPSKDDILKAKADLAKIATVLDDFLRCGDDTARARLLTDKQRILLEAFIRSKKCLYGPHCSTLGDTAFRRLGTRFVYFYAADGQHEWLPHDLLTTALSSPDLSDVEIKLFRSHLQLDRTIAVRPSRAEGTSADEDVAHVASDPSVATMLLPHVLPVDKRCCCQWVQYDEKTKSTQTLVQVQLTGRQLGWIQDLTMSTHPEYGHMEPHVASNDERLLFHFTCPTVLRTASDVFKSKITFRLHLAELDTSDCGQMEFTLELKGPLDMQLEQFRFSSIVNMDIFGLVKQSFVFSLLSPATVADQYTVHLRRLGRFFPAWKQTEPADPRVPDKLREALALAFSSAPLMKKLSSTLPLQAITAQVDAAKKDADFAAELRRLKEDSKNLTDAQKKQQREDAAVMAARFCTFESGQMEYRRYREQHPLPSQLDSVQEFGVVYYCERILATALLVDLCVGGFELRAATRLYRFLHGMLIASGVAVLAVGIAAAGFFSFGIVPAAVGGGMAGLVALSIGSGVNVVRMLQEVELNYKDKLITLCEILKLKPRELPSCSFVLEKALLDKLKKQMSSDKVAAEYSDSGYHMIEELTDSQLTRLFGRMIQDVGELNRVKEFLLDVHTVHELRRLLLQSFTISVSGPMNQGKSTLLRLLDFDAAAGADFHTRDLQGFPWVDGLYFVDFPGFDDNDRATAATFDCFEHLSNAFILVCSYQLLDSQHMSQYLAHVLRSNKPFLLCINKADAELAVPVPVGVGRARKQERPSVQYRTAGELVRLAKQQKLGYCMALRDERTGRSLGEALLFEHEIDAFHPGRVSCCFTAFDPPSTFRESPAAVLAAKQAGFWTTRNILGWLETVLDKREPDIHKRLVEKLKTWEEECW